MTKTSHSGAIVLAGQLDGIHEPGLILTPAEKATDEDHMRRILPAGRRLWLWVKARQRDRSAEGRQRQRRHTRELRQAASRELSLSGLR